MKTIKPSTEVNFANFTQNILQLHHERMGHQNKRHVKATIKRELGIDIPLDSELCEGCILGKAHRLKFGKRTRSTIPGERLHADVCGPFTPSNRGYRYFVLFKDDYTRFRFLYFIKHKNEVSQKLKLALAEINTAGYKVKELLTDNGGEFDNQTVKSILEQHGIRQRLTMPYTPEQHGCVERDNRTVVETARAMMYAHERFPQVLWAELINAAVYILNLTGPSSALNKSPMELWQGTKPSIKHLRIIGSECFVHVPKEKRKKMDPKAKRGFLVGIEPDGYRIWFKESNTVIRSRDVIFKEIPLQVNTSSLPIRTQTEETPDKESQETPYDEDEMKKDI